MGGGFGNALVGTVVVVGIGGLISIPIGVLAAVFLAELGPDGRLAQVARFATKTLTGLPSILAGVFAYAVVVLLTGTYSAPAGGIALAVLMLPTVVLTAEEAIKAVPKVTRDAAYGMGCTRSQVVWKVLLPTGMPGILTGVMLAVARAAGRDGAAALHGALQQLLALRGRPALSSCSPPRPSRCSSTTSRACRSRTRSSWRGPPRWSSS